MLMEDQIIVTIPAQEYQSRVYIDSKNCYLATALKKAGYENVHVDGFGEAIINGVKFTSNFNACMCKREFALGNSIEVILKSV